MLDFNELVEEELRLSEMKRLKLKHPFSTRDVLFKYLKFFAMMVILVAFTLQFEANNNP